MGHHCVLFVRLEELTLLHMDCAVQMHKYNCKCVTTVMDYIHGFCNSYYLPLWTVLSYHPASPSPLLWPKLLHQSVLVVTLCTYAGVKWSVGLSVVIVKIARFWHLGTWAALSITNQLKSVTNWLECASNHYAQLTDVTNSVLLSAIVAMPIDCTHQLAAKHTLSITIVLSESPFSLISPQYLHSV